MNFRSLEIVVGKKVVDADLTPQDGGLVFEGGITLNIYNRYAVFDRNQVAVGKILVGMIVTKVEEEKDHIFIIFGEEIKMEIDLTDDAYYYPEAMQLRVPGKSIVIWN